MAAKVVSLVKSFKVSFAKGQNPYCNVCACFVKSQNRLTYERNMVNPVILVNRFNMVSPLIIFNLGILVISYDSGDLGDSGKPDDSGESGDYGESGDSC